MHIGIFYGYMNNQTVQITQKGLDALEKELSELVGKKRPHLVSRLADARSEGDLKENSDYQNAKDELAFLDGRIEELESVIKTAIVVSNDPQSSGIGVGTKVTLKVGGGEVIFEIVGEWEADPIKKKISSTSPLGNALSGKKVGDKVEVDAPAGKVVYEIVSVQ